MSVPQLDTDVLIVRVVRDGHDSHIVVRVLSSNTVLKCVVPTPHQCSLPQLQEGQRSTLRLLTCKPPVITVRIMRVDTEQANSCTGKQSGQNHTSNAHLNPRDHSPAHRLAIYRPFHRPVQANTRSKKGYNSEVRCPPPSDTVMQPPRKRICFEAVVAGN